MQQIFLRLLVTYKTNAETIFHTPKSDSGYGKALRLIKTILTRTVSELKLSWEDTTNNEFNQLMIAENTLTQYRQESPDINKKEVIDNFRTVLVEKLNGMIHTREKKPDLPKDVSKEN